MNCTVTKLKLRIVAGIETGTDELHKPNSGAALLWSEVCTLEMNITPLCKFVSCSQLEDLLPHGAFSIKE
jgi:hypothetical protein